MDLETHTREGRGPDHRLVYFCLSISLVLHVIASWLLPADGEDKKPPEHAANPALMISLVGPMQPASAPVTSVPEASLDGLREITTARRRKSVPAPTVSDLVRAPRLNLSVPALPQEKQGVTRGTVVSKQLNQQLAEFGRDQSPSRRTRGYTALDAGQSSFESGRWASRVQLGDKCFRVVTADPLQPGSFEQWFAIKCDS